MYLLVTLWLLTTLFLLRRSRSGHGSRLIFPWLALGMIILLTL